MSVAVMLLIRDIERRGNEGEKEERVMDRTKERRMEGGRKG